MNTYIQDKLDEVMKNIELGGNVKANIEKALTDYHNHILEEMENIFTTLCDIDKYTNDMAVNDFGKLMNKLQDTNQKE